MDIRRTVSCPPEKNYNPDINLSEELPQILPKSGEYTKKQAKAAKAAMIILGIISMPLSGFFIFGILLSATWWGGSPQASDYLKIAAVYFIPLCLDLVLYMLWYSKRGISLKGFAIFTACAYIPLTLWTLYLISMA